MAKSKSYRVLVLSPSFLGHGDAGRLVRAGSEVLMDLEIAEDDIPAVKGDNGQIVRKAVKKGDPIVGSNLEIIGEASSGAVETVPVDLPVGAIPDGQGNWLVPVGTGSTYELWKPGDPTTDLARQPPQAFQSNQGQTGLAAAERFNDPRFDGDGDGGMGGSLSDDDIRAMLAGYQVEVPADADRAALLKLFHAEKAKRIPGPPADGDDKRTKADITRELDALDPPVTYDPKEKKEALAALLDSEKAKREPPQA